MSSAMRSIAILAICASVAAAADPAAESRNSPAQPPPELGRFFSAVTSNDTATAAVLLKKRPRLANMKNAAGFAPLHSAAMKGHAAMARLLIEHGAVVNARQDRFERTPLQYAAIYGHRDIVELLLDHHAAIDDADPGGLTPLMLAADAGRKEVVETLLARGADRNATSKAGWTARDYAERNGRHDVVKLLTD